MKISSPWKPPGKGNLMAVLHGREKGPRTRRNPSRELVAFAQRLRGGLCRLSLDLMSYEEIFGV